MIQRIKKAWKVALLDFLGVFLILISPLTGIIPGPGGIPVFLAGLGLLAVNHEWARRLLEFVKNRGQEFVQKIFSENPMVKWLYDLVSVLLVFAGAWILIEVTSSTSEAIAVVMVFSGAALFLGNRERLQMIVAALKQKLQ